MKLPDSARGSALAAALIMSGYAMLGVLIVALTMFGYALLAFGILLTPTL